ncbi:PEP-utilizing enzyme [Verrucomicrobiota bacterium sgz303538]
MLFGWVLRQARDRVRNRENLRFDRTKLFGWVRRVFVELGRRFEARGILENSRDVFYLELNEVLGVVEGTATTIDLLGLVRVRKAEFQRYRETPAPADRLTTRGPVAFTPEETLRGASPELTVDATGTPSVEERKGLGCCPGVVRGRVRVVSDPRDAVLQPGEILVAERTDPGWVILFPMVSGLLVERGSLLSHSAIVSRELGLPGIVSIPHLTSWLRTGDEVVMDGTTGVLKRLNPVQP